MEPSELVMDTEGEVEFFRPDAGSDLKGPAKKNRSGFYNPAMADARTVGALLLRLFKERLSRSGKPRVFDAMCATGIRGLRLAVEGLEGDEAEITLNDINPEAAELARRNVKLLEDRGKLYRQDVEVSNKDMNAVLAENGGYDYIDLDPFGTPAPYIQSVVRSVRVGGIVAVTATDTAALFGTYPRVGRRRYMAAVHRSPVNYEAGLRALMGAVVRQAASLEVGLEPILSYYQGHYLRTYLKRVKYIKRIDRNLGKMGYYMFNKGTGRLSVLEPGNPGVLTRAFDGSGTDSFVDGPLWHGPLGMRDIGEKLVLLCEGPLYSPLKDLLTLVARDQEAPLYFYRTDEISRSLKQRAPKLSKLIETVKSAGYEAHRTHFHPMGFKSDAPWDVVRSVF